MDNFGAKMMLAVFVVKGNISHDLCKSVVHKIVKEIELDIIPGDVTYDYPYKGKGGVGFTFIQPITESFIAWDVWKKMNGGYLVICSCKLFWATCVTRILKSAGLSSELKVLTTLSLDD